MESKACTRCGEHKPFSEFYKHTFRGKKGLRPDCKTCLNEQNVRAHAQRRELLNALKSAPCVDCGKAYPPYVMDYDHVRGTKVKDVGLMIGCKWSTVLQEIEKCDLVCSNCHRIRTHVRRQLARSNRL